jgi:transcriptional/translational regulatory protein YebC/TACO1
VITHDDGSIEVQTPWEVVGVVADAMAKAGLPPESTDVAMIAATLVTLDKDGAEALLGLVDALEDLDDVQNVYTNADIPVDVMEQLGG